jgi:hypothetical protein
VLAILAAALAEFGGTLRRIAEWVSHTYEKQK